MASLGSEAGIEIASSAALPVRKSFDREYVAGAESVLGSDR